MVKNDLDKWSLDRDKLDLDGGKLGLDHLQQKSLKKQSQWIRSRNNYAKYVLYITVLSKIYKRRFEMRSITVQEFSF